MKRKFNLMNSNMWIPGIFIDNEYLWFRKGQIVWFDTGKEYIQCRIKSFDKCWEWAQRSSNRPIQEYAVYVYIEPLDKRYCINGISGKFSLIGENIGLSEVDLERQRFRRERIYRDCGIVV